MTAKAHGKSECQCLSYLHDQSEASFATKCKFHTQPAKREVIVVLLEGSIKNNAAKNYFATHNHQFFVHLINGKL